MSGPRRFFCGLAVLAAAALLASSVPARAQTLAVVRVGALPTDNSGNLYFAIELGYFKNAGLDVELEPAQNGSATAAALAAGAIDVAQSNTTATAAGYLRGFDFRIFAPAAISGDRTLTNAVMVPADSTVRTAADLNGKTVAIPGVKSIQQVLAMAWIDKHGGDAKSVKFAEVPYPQMGAQLAAHRVDAAIITEPFLTAAKTAGRVIGNADDGIGQRFIGLAWVSSSAWLRKNPDVASRFAAAVRQAGVWANTHPNESADILVKYSKLDPDIVHAMARATYATTVEPALVQPMIDASAKYGAIDRAIPAAEIVSVPK